MRDTENQQDSYYSMDTYFAVLPSDITDAVVPQLSSNDNQQTPPPLHFLRLPHPRTGIPSLFLSHDPKEGRNDNSKKQSSTLLEVQAVAPPNARSWFMGEEVVSDGRLLVMTPIDPLFLLIPILGTTELNVGGKVNFRPADDIFQEAGAKLAETPQATAPVDPSLVVTADDIMRFGTLECTRGAMARICEVKEITTEITVFKYSREKLMEQLRGKITALSAPRIAEMSRCLVRGLAKDALMEDGHETLLELGRTRLACDLLAQYLPPDVVAELRASYDFAKLDTHVKTLQRQQLDIPPDSSITKKTKKVTSVDPKTSSKKRKVEPKASQGVQKLRKLNVDGMAKLSTFFSKKAA